MNSYQNGVFNIDTYLQERIRAAATTSEAAAYWQATLVDITPRQIFTSPGMVRNMFARMSDFGADSSYFYSNVGSSFPLISAAPNVTYLDQTAMTGWAAELTASGLLLAGTTVANTDRAYTFAPLSPNAEAIFGALVRVSVPQNSTIGTAGIIFCGYSPTAPVSSVGNLQSSAPNVVTHIRLMPQMLDGNRQEFFVALFPSIKGNGSGTNIASVCFSRLAQTVAATDPVGSATPVTIILKDDLATTTAATVSVRLLTRADIGTILTSIDNDLRNRVGLTASPVPSCY